MREISRYLGLLAFSFLLSWPTVAQSASEVGANPTEEATKEAQDPALDEVESIDLSGAVRLQPDEIPEYNVVTGFFLRARSLLGSDSRHQQDFFLRSIGVEPGTPAADFVAEITAAADGVLRIETVDWSLRDDEAAFDRAQYAAIRDKARKLGIVYRNLLYGLKEAGVSPQGVLGYCAEMRSTLSVRSTEEDNRDYFEATSAFDEELEKISELLDGGDEP